MLDQVLGICGHFISIRGYSTTAVMACAHRNINYTLVKIFPFCSTFLQADPSSLTRPYKKTKYRLLYMKLLDMYLPLCHFQLCSLQ